jgi:hypothetical protein
VSLVVSACITSFAAADEGSTSNEQYYFVDADASARTWLQSADSTAFADQIAAIEQASATSNGVGAVGAIAMTIAAFHTVMTWSQATPSTRGL